MEYSPLLDIVGNLPLELSLKILDQLNSCQLALCSCVCRKWREITNCDTLWKKFLPNYERKVPLQHKTEVCNNKALFSRFATTLNKWKKMNFRECTLPASFGFAELANGAVIAVVQPRKIEVIDLNNGQTKKLQEIDLKLPKVYMTQHFLTSAENDVLVVSANYGEYNVVYRWTGTALEFEDCVYGQILPFELITLTSTNVNNGPPDGSSLITCEPLIVVKNLVFLLSTNTVYCWSFRERRCVGQTDLELNGRRKCLMKVQDHAGKVYFCLRDKICVYDSRTHKIIQLLKFPENNLRDFTKITLQFNESTVLAVHHSPIGGSQVFAWNMSWKMICEPFDAETTCVLHPRLPVVIDIKSTYDSCGNCSKVLVAENLCSKSIIWSSPLYDRCFFNQTSQILISEEKIIRFSDIHIGILNALSHDPETMYIWQYVDLESGRTSITESFITTIDIILGFPDYFNARKIICPYSSSPFIKKILVFT